MDARETNAFMNMMLYGFGAALYDLMDISKLQFNRKCGDAIMKGGTALWKEVGLPEITSTDVKEICEQYAAGFKDKKITNRFELLEYDDDTLVIDAGECVFAPATKFLSELGMDIPPCPVIGGLLSVIAKNTGKNGLMTDAKLVPEHNTRIFTIKLR